MAKAFAHRTGSLSAANPANANPGPKDPFAAGSQLQLQQKIRADQEKVEKLTAQKVALAQRLQSLVMKAAGRVEADLTRVRIASGELPAPQPVVPEPPSEIPSFTVPPTLQIPAASPATIATALPVPATKANEPRSAPAPPPTVDALGSTPNAQLQNKRMLSLHLVSVLLMSYYYRTPYDNRWCFHSHCEQPFCQCDSSGSCTRDTSYASSICSSSTGR